MAASLISVLRCAGRGKRAAKRWFYSPAAGRPVKENFDAGMFFDLDLRPVADIHQLAGLLARLEPDPLAFVIRGVPKPGIGQGARVRHKKKPDVRTGQEPHFTDAEAGLSWVMLDFDKVPAPASIDPINDPEEAVLWLVGLLPAEFQDVAFYWQASASAGMGDGRTLSAHVWFWLGRNVTDAELTAWSEGHDLPVDVSLFRTVQPHWTAAPIFEDVRDPLPRRSGLWCGLEDAVDFPPVEVRPRRSYTDGEAAGAGLRLGEARGFEAKLALLGDRDGHGRPGFHRVLLSATASYAATHGRDGTDVAALKARIREAIEAAPKSPQRTRDEIGGYLSDAYLDDIIGSALDNYGDARPDDDEFPTGGGATPPPPEGSPEAAQAELRAALDGFLARILTAEEGEAAADPADPERAAEGEEAEDGGRALAAIKAPAGLGKTAAVLEMLARPELIGRNINYFVPEHRLSEELVEGLAAVAGENGPRGLVIRGRAQKCPDSDGDMCLKPDIAEQVARLGASVYETLCYRKVNRKVDGKNVTVEERCQHFDNCPYIAQFDDAAPAVRFMPHAYMHLPKPAGMPAADLNVIDERFWPSSLRGMNGRSFVPLARLNRRIDIERDHGPKGRILDFNKTADMDAFSSKAFRVFEAAAGEGRQPSPAEFRAAGLTAGDCEFCMIEWLGLVEQLDVTPGMAAAEQRKRLEIAKATEAYRMARFWRILSYEIDHERDRLHGLELVDDAVNGDGLPEQRIVMRWSADLRTGGTHLLLIDADLDPEIARRFIPTITDDDFVTIEAEQRGGEFVQITDRACSKGMLAYGGLDPAEAQRSGNRRADLRALVAAAAAAVDGRTLAITYKDAEEVIRAEGELPGVEWSHFNAIRGRDQWRDVAALVAAGRPQPSPRDLERVTAALFYKDPQPIQRLPADLYGRVAYQKVRAAYHMADGTIAPAYVDDHPDPLCSMMLRQIRECELMQVLTRARLIWRDPVNPCRVIVATNIPLPIKVNRLTTWDQLIPNRFVRAFWRHRAMPLSDAELARVYPDLWPSEGAVKQARTRWGEKGYVSLSDSIIGVRTPFSAEPYHTLLYRRPGQRGHPSPALVRPGRGRLRAALEPVVGPVTEFRVTVPDLETARAAEGDGRVAPAAMGLRATPSALSPAEAWRFGARVVEPAPHPPSEPAPDNDLDDTLDGLDGLDELAPEPETDTFVPEAAAAAAGDSRAPEDDPAEACNWARDPPPDGDLDGSEPPLPDRPRPVDTPPPDPARAAAEALRRLGGAA